jgi:hypothetical protein
MLRAVLTAGVLAGALALPSAAHAAATCPAPATGLRACLDARWSVDHGEVTRVRAAVTLLQRVPRCSAHGARRAILSSGGERMGTLRARPTCRDGVLRWRTTFTREDTAGWPLQKGDVLELGWSGTQATASVKLTGGGTKATR